MIPHVPRLKLFGLLAALVLVASSTLPATALAAQSPATTGPAPANIIVNDPTPAPTPPAIGVVSQVPELTPATFSNPPDIVRPLYRWWMPLADTSDTELATELQQMKDGGAGGAEVDPFPIPGGGTYAVNPYLATYGWGTPLWAHKLQVMYQAAVDKNMALDVTVSPNWPATVPSVSGINDPAAGQQLIFGRELVNAGSARSGAMPATTTTPPTTSTTTCGPTSIGANSFNVASITGELVGDTVTVGTGGNLESVVVTGVSGSPTSACTTLAGPASAGASTIYVAAVTGFAAGQTVLLGSGAGQETAVVASVGTAAGTATTLFAAAALGDSNVKVTSATGFTVGHQILLDTGANFESPTITAVGTQGRNTTLSVASVIGATGVRVASTTGLAAGDSLLIDTAGNLETATIASIPTPAPGSPNPNVLLTAALTKAHASGVAASDPGSGITFAPPLTLAHAAGAAIRDSGTGIALTAGVSLAHASGDAVVGGNSTLTFTPALAQVHASGQTVTDAAKKTLVAVIAAQCTSACVLTGSSPRLLDPASSVDLTSLVDGSGNLSWTAPTGNGHPWALIDYYQTADGQTKTGLTTTTPNYVIDHFGPLGAQALTNYYSSSVISSATQDLINQAISAAFFEDSLELGQTNVKWTWNMLSQFQALRGYSLATLLPAIAGTQIEINATPFFDFANVGPRVRTDFRQTLSDLWVQNHIQVYNDFAHAHGLLTRMQVEGPPMEMADTSSYIDIPEAENRNFLDDPEMFKLVAVATHLTDGRPIMSDECCGIQNTVWASTAAGAEPISAGRGASNTMNLPTIYKAFEGGVNQLVWHGFPYISGPAGSSNAESLWPGFTYGGNTSVNEAWGPRMPQWSDYRTVNDNFARLQLVLRQGKPRFDFAVYWDDYGCPNCTGVVNNTQYNGYVGANSTLTASSNSAAAGYTYEYVSPSYLRDGSKAVYVPGATANDGAFFPDYSAYKALVLNDTATGTRTMPVDVLQKIYNLAHDSKMPLVIIGALPNQTPGYNNSVADDAAIAALDTQVTGLIGDPTYKVALIATEASLPATLAGFGITPAAAHLSNPTSASILDLRRHTATTDYYYLFNQATSAVDQTISLSGSGLPYKLDTWTGAITPIGNYSSIPGGVTLPIHLAADDVAVIAISTTNLDGGGTPNAVYATSTTAASALYVNNQPAIRATGNGTFFTTLSSGQTLSTTLSDVPSSQYLNSWTLRVDSWTNDATDLPGLDHTLHTAIPASGTIAVNANASHALPAWTAITPTNGYSVNLQDVSGIGTYTTHVTVPSGWTGGHGAYLNLGSVTDTFHVAVNGATLPPIDFQDIAKIDVGPYLHDGDNTIVVTVASTLINAVRVAPNSGATSRSRQDCGLFGPVQLIPYDQVDVLATTTTVSAAVNPTSPGYPTTLSALVAPVSTGGAVPTGTVQFSVDSSPFGAPVTLDSTGAAALPPFPVLSAGAHTVSAAYSGDATYLSSTSSTITHTVGLSNLSGTFTAGGVPQTGGAVYAFYASTSGFAGSSPVDGSGNYSLDLQTGSYKLFLAPSSPGYAMQWFGGVDYASATSISVSGNTVQSIALAGVYTISGAFTAGGTPQIGGTVYVFSAAGSYVGSATADGSGNYSFGYVPAGSYKLYVAPSSPGYSMQWFGSTDGTFATATAVAVSSNTVQNIALAGLYSLSGTFTAGGTPQAGGTVYVFDGSSGSYLGSSPVDGSGNYNFGFLPAGTYKLYLQPSSAGYGMQWFGSTDGTFATATAVAVSSNTVQNIALAGVYTLSGSFTGGGVPQAGGTVYVFDASGNYVGSSTADGSGNYSYSFLPAGSYKLYVVPTGAGYAAQWFGSTDGTFATATSVVVSGNTTANVALPGEYTLSGNFTAGGSPQTGGALYVFTDAGSYVGSASVDGSGHYSFGYLAAGSYKIYLAPVSADYSLQWYGGSDFASATTFNLSAPSILNIAL